MRHISSLQKPGRSSKEQRSMSPSLFLAVGSGIVWPRLLGADFAWSGFSCAYVQLLHCFSLASPASGQNLENQRYPLASLASPSRFFISHSAVSPSPSSSLSVPMRTWRRRLPRAGAAAAAGLLLLLSPSCRATPVEPTPSAYGARHWQGAALMPT